MGPFWEVEANGGPFWKVGADGGPIWKVGADGGPFWKVGAGRGPFLRAENWKNSGALSGKDKCWTAFPDPDPPGIVSSYEPQ